MPEDVKIIKMGKPERAEFTIADTGEEDDTDTSGADGAGGAGAADEETPEAKAEKLTADYAAKFPDLKGPELEEKIKEEEGKKVPQLSEEQLKNLFKQTFGEDFNGNIEELKEKLKPKAAEPTAEEKLKMEADLDKKRLDIYLEAGGTIENYTAIKTIMNMDLTELSKTELKKELKAANFNDDEIAAIMKERYYQLNPDELVQDENELDEVFEKRKADLKKKVDYGTTKLTNRSSHIKKQAEATFKNLDIVIQESEAKKTESAKQEAQILSTIDEVISKVAKKVTFELGMVNDTAVSPVEHEVDAKDLSDVAAMLKDPLQRNNIFKNQDGSLNVKAIAEILIENKNLKKLVKVGYVEAGTRQVEEFRRKFPFISAAELGLGNNGSTIKSGGKGKIASSGQPQRVKAGQE